MRLNRGIKKQRRRLAFFFWKYLQQTSTTYIWCCAEPVDFWKVINYKKKLCFFNQIHIVNTPHCFLSYTILCYPHQGGGDRTFVSSLCSSPVRWGQNPKRDYLHQPDSRLQGRHSQEHLQNGRSTYLTTPHSHVIGTVATSCMSASYQDKQHK